MIDDNISKYSFSVPFRLNIDVSVKKDNKMIPIRKNM